MTDSRANWLRLNEQRVAIAIGGDRFQHQIVSGALAFGPKLLARAAKECDAPGLEGFVESLTIHVANHEHTGVCILDHHRDETALFIKIENFGHRIVSEMFLQQKSPRWAGLLEFQLKIERRLALTHQAMVRWRWAFLLIKPQYISRSFAHPQNR